MRRIVTLSCAALLFGLAACGDDSNTGKVPSDATTATDATTSGDATTATDASTTTGTDATISNDTSRPDTTVANDTTPVDEGEGTCIGILACASSDCASATSQDAFNQCVQGCAAGAETQAEVQAFSAEVTCEGDCVPEGVSNPPTGEEEKGIYACLLENCVDANHACQAGADFGTRTCLQLNACLTACGAGGSPRCIRDCFAESTEAAGKVYVQLNYCIFSQCADKNGADFNSCAVAAQQNPPCQTYVTQCQGNSGAAPGAGGGGGASGARESMDPSGFRAMRGFQH